MQEAIEPRPEVGHRTSLQPEGFDDRLGIDVLLEGADDLAQLTLYFHAGRTDTPIKRTI